jgi:predicted MFS family arabinose efflux permease
MTDQTDECSSIEPPRYAWQLAAIMFATWGVVFQARMAQFYLMPYIAADLHLSHVQIGELASAIAVFWALSALLFGAISDRVGRKIILWPLTIALAAFSALSGLSHSFAQLWAARALAGAAGGPCWSVMNSLVEQSSNPKHRGRNIGLVVSAAALIGLGAGPVLSTQVASYAGWRVAFFIIGAPVLVCAVLTARYVREPSQPGSAHSVVEQGLGGIVSLLKYRNIWLCAIAAAGIMSWLFLQNVFAPLYIMEVEHQDPRTAGLLLGAAGLGSFVIGIAGSALSDRASRRGVLVGMALLSSILPLILMVHGLYAHLWLLATLLFLTHGGQALMALTLVVIPAESVPRHLIGAAIGLVTFVGELVGGALVPAVAGLVSQSCGLQGPLWMAVGGTFLALFAALLLKKAHTGGAVENRFPV